MTSQVKEVFFNPNLSFDNLNYNVEKNSNAIMQDININLNEFDNCLNMSGGSHSNLESRNKIKEQFNEVHSIDPVLNNLDNVSQNIQTGSGSPNLSGNEEYDEDLSNSSSNLLSQSGENFNSVSINLNQSGGGKLDNVNLASTGQEQTDILSNGDIEQFEVLNSQSINNSSLRGGAEESLEDSDTQFGGADSNKQINDNDYDANNEENISDEEMEDPEDTEDVEEDIDNDSSLEKNSLKDTEEINLDISSYDEIIHPLVNINIVKKIVKKWINNFNSKEYEKYQENIRSFYQKNIKKYEIRRESKKLNLYQKKDNNKVSSINIPVFYLIDDERKKLNKKIKLQKTELISLFLKIKYNSNIKSELLPSFETLKKSYSNNLNLLTSYNIYENLINKNTSDLNEETELPKEINLFLPNLKIDIDSNLYIENEHYLVNENYIKDILDISKTKNNQYNDIMNELDSKKKIDDNLKNKIKEYLDNNKKKGFNTIINSLKNKKKSKINFVIDNF